jgi:hypothetical protein
MLVMVVGSASEGMEAASWVWKAGEKDAARAWAARPLPGRPGLSFAAVGESGASSGWIESLVRFFYLNIYQLPLARVRQSFFRALFLPVGERYSEKKEILLIF